MLDWIDAFVYRWVNVVDTPVRDVVKWSVHALAGVVYTVFGNVGGAWRRIVGFGDSFIREIAHYTSIVDGWIRQIVLTDIPAVWHSLLGYVQYLENLAVRLWNDAIAKIAAATRYLESLVQSAIQWVITNVYDPLKAEAERIYNDLLKWGYWSWQLLNDPGRLAALLLGALIAAAEAAFFTIAAPLGRFVVGLIIHQAAKLLVVIEDIFTAVL